LESDIRLKHGDPVDTQALLGDMDAVNDNPFRKVNLIYQPSSQPGYTDLVLQTQDRLPVRVYSGFDNSGTAATGHDRWNFGAVWGNVLGTDSQVSYQFSSSSDLFTQPSHAAGEPGGWSFQGHTLSWTMPFHWGDSLMVFGNYERSVPNVGVGLGMLGLNGQASLRYIHNLPRTETFTESLQAGYDFKTTNNNLDFGGTAVSANAVEIDQFPVSYSAGLKDRWGATSMVAGLTYSPSGITANNNTAAFQPGLAQSGRALASARYIYFRCDLNRHTRLPKDLSYSLHVTGQSTNSNLLYTEQLAGGGPEILRGYEPFAILGDEGLLMSNELRAPAIRKLGEYSNLGELQFLTFWDYGSVYAHQPVAGDLNSVTASSAGVGVRYNLRSNIAARFDYGWVLRSIPGTQAGSSMAAISLMVGN
jgi:hemolysin activation/secretion protein